MKTSSREFDLALFFAALADPTRLRILNLMAGREVCVCYFVAILRLGQPKISRHLAYLRRAGIVSARREGKWMHYRIRRIEDQAADSILTGVLAALAGNKDMQEDTAKLGRFCCEPEKSAARVGAPCPVLIA